MANKIILKKSSVVGKSPQTGDLDYGEMALNYADGKLFYKNSVNEIKFLGERGFTGSIGFTGSQGYTGSQGEIGYTGSQGESGRVQWIKKTANYTAVDQDGIIADTSAGSFTVTLPATPVLGTIVTIVDGSDWTLNPLTVDRNGSTIEGVADNTLLDITGAQVTFLYDGATWQIFASFISWGYTGSQGYTGSAGAGFTGSAGVNGFTGSQGELGYTGSAGIGYTGSQGATGYTGSQGTINIADDTATNSSFYVPFTTATTGFTNSLTVSSTKLYFNPSTGQLNATEFNSLSDETFKVDINPINDALALINKLEGFKFTWKDSGKPSLGVSAQNVEKYIPELVSNGEYKTVNYNGLIPLLIQAIKELDRKLNEK